MSYIVIDQGTSSTKAFLFDSEGEIIYSMKKKYRIKTLEPFHIEFDPTDILDDIIYLFNKMASFPHEDRVYGVGFTFQRSTFLFWEKSTCKPLTPAISGRTAEHPNI